MCHYVRTLAAVCGHPVTEDVHRCPKSPSAEAPCDIGDPHCKLTHNPDVAGKCMHCRQADVEREGLAHTQSTQQQSFADHYSQIDDFETEFEKVLRETRELAEEEAMMREEEEVQRLVHETRKELQARRQLHGVGFDGAVDDEDFEAQVMAALEASIREAEENRGISEEDEVAAALAASKADTPAGFLRVDEDEDEVIRRLMRQTAEEHMAAQAHAAALSGAMTEDDPRMAGVFEQSMEDWHKCTWDQTPPSEEVGEESEDEWTPEPEKSERDQEPRDKGKGKTKTGWDDRDDDDSDGGPHKQDTRLLQEVRDLKVSVNVSARAHSRGGSPSSGPKLREHGRGRHVSSTGPSPSRDRQDANLPTMAQQRPLPGMPNPSNQGQTRVRASTPGLSASQPHSSPSRFPTTSALPSPPAGPFPAVDMSSPGPAFRAAAAPLPTSSPLASLAPPPSPAPGGGFERTAALTSHPIPAGEFHQRPATPALDTLREEQDLAYHKSLAADREKLRRRRDEDDRHAKRESGADKVAQDRSRTGRADEGVSDRPGSGREDSNNDAKEVVENEPTDAEYVRRKRLDFLARLDM